MQTEFRTHWDINLRGHTGTQGPHEAYGSVKAWTVTSTSQSAEVDTQPMAGARVPTQGLVVYTWCCWHLMWHQVSGGGSHSTWASTATSRPSSSITHSLSLGPSWGQRTCRFSSFSRWPCRVQHTPALSQVGRKSWS